MKILSLRYLALVLLLLGYVTLFSQENPDTSSFILPQLPPDTTNSTNENTEYETPFILPTEDTTSQSSPYTEPDTSSGFSNAFGSDDEFQFFFSKEDEVKFLEYKPILTLGTGVLNYKGDVRDTYHKDFTMGAPATMIAVSKNVNEYMMMELSVIMGKLTGNERGERNLNFQTSMLCAGANLTYNFGHFLEKEGYLIRLIKQRKVFPFVSFGVETFNFSSKGDMFDAEGNEYHYWSDGTIRSESENSENAANSIVLQRDYEYETDLRELELDSLGPYGQNALAIPIHVGADLIIHERVILRLGTSIHYSLNDMIDNVSIDSRGNRKGNAMGDWFLYTYAGLKVDVFSSEKIIDYGSLVENPDHPNLLKIYYADEDKDNILDFFDNCLETPLGVQVDKHGCPIDCDKDGIPDFKEVSDWNTPKDSIVNLQGIMFTDEMKQELAKDTLVFGVPTDDIYVHYPSMRPKEAVKGFEQFYEDIPVRFKHVDRNGDEYITFDELLFEIDKFFDGESKLRLEEIYDLNEFFFNQEETEW